MFELTKRPIGLDDLADVRYLHTAAFRITGSTFHSEEEIDAYISRINSNEYLRECLNCSLHGLWHDHILIGTAGWCPSNDQCDTARIRKVFVHNFYVGLGLGRMMVEETEERAFDAGFTNFSIRTSPGSMAFFKNLGYIPSSHGALALKNGQDIPVTYMRKDYVKAKHTSTPSNTHTSEANPPIAFPG